MTNTLNKTLVAAGALLALTATSNALVVASWDTWGTDTGTSTWGADSVETGFTASLLTSGTDERYIASFGSTDGTFGSALSGANTALGGQLLRARNNVDTVTVTLTNSTGSDFNITNMHFDYEVREASGNFSFRDFDVTYVSGGLGPASASIDSQSDLTAGEYDFDYTLSSSLSDILLANGESAVFEIAFSNNQNSIDVSGIFDNIAFQGTVVPEPSSFALLAGCFGMTWVMLRRRRA
jgi:hypothetical protein